MIEEEIFFSRRLYSINRGKYRSEDACERITKKPQVATNGDIILHEDEIQQSNQTILR